MTKFKVCGKIHLFIIISVLAIVIGMAVGTICHFCANGFFNYGGEFKSYKSVTVTYYSSEYKSASEVRELCDESLKGFDAYETSVTDTTMGGEIVYKYSAKTDSAKLNAAVTELNSALDKNGSGLNVASMHEGVVEEGGSRAIIYASIAVAAAAAFQFLYFTVRYKLRAAFSALLANVHNLGLFVALAAITRIPVGIATVALGAFTVLVTMLMAAILFDRTRKNFKNEKYAKTDRVEVIDISACESRPFTVYVLSGLAICAVVLGVFAAISSLYVGALSLCALTLLALISCAYGTLFFTPAVHSAIDGVCEKVKKASASGKRAKASGK